MRLRNVLIANRGEIALRVLRTARALGYRTTAIYSAADAGAPHVVHADAAVPVGPAAVGESYLNIARVIEAAQQSGADAVHPGYGFLSENAAFASACRDAGLVFIGPSPETIELMGDKRRARIAMQQAGVACVPGYDGDDQSDATLEREAARIGFPLMVKAARGGGGRGMRRVQATGELAEAIARARSEASKAFGDDRLVLERALDGARHVEVQIVADGFGHVIHLGERDCSVQRRFQKVIEEAPSPAVDPALRERLGALAVLAAKSSGYVGVGTVELLLDARGEFYFLEMNTRIQVEHPVTELVTGLDIVALQLRIAEGEPLPLGQVEVQLHGHAIEARLYAEDAARGFVPSAGRIAHLSLPAAEGIRIDHALAVGLQVSSHYDPMLAKVIAHGRDREEARRRLLRALEDLRLFGVTTNQGFLCALLEHPEFAAARATTDFLERNFAAVSVEPPGRDAWIAAAASYALFAMRGAEGGGELASFSNCAGLQWPLALACDDARVELRLQPTRQRNELLVHLGDERVLLGDLAGDAHHTTFVVEGVRRRIDHAWDGAQLWLHTSSGISGTRVFRDLTYAPPAATAAQGSGRALAPMDGSVVDLPARIGEAVTRGQTLAVVEAMKLELRVSADIDGIVHAVHVQRGQQVKARQVLVELAPATT
jgi:geranyl-CoA carboxylase alpha subunit